MANETPDYENRANLMWAATMALNGLIGMGVKSDWATHMIGHELTAFHGIDHGVTLAIVLPGLLTKLKEETRREITSVCRKSLEYYSEGSDDERKTAGYSENRRVLPKCWYCNSFRRSQCRTR